MNYKKFVFLFSFAVIMPLSLGVILAESFLSISVKDYSNVIAGYTTKYPEKMEVKEDSSGVLSHFVFSNEDAFIIGVYAKQNPKKITADEWANLKFQNADAQKVGEVFVDSIKSPVFRANFLSGNSEFVFVQYQDRIFEIEYRSPRGSLDTHLKEFEETFLKNFKPLSI